MKGVFRDILIALTMGVVMPSVVLSFGVALEELREEKIASQAEEITGEETEQIILPEFSPVEENSGLKMLFRREDGEVTAMDMDEYLLLLSAYGCMSEALDEPLYIVIRLLARHQRLHIHILMRHRYRLI